VRTEEKGCAADAHSAPAASAKSRGAVEQRIYLLNASFQRDELRAALHYQGCVETVSFVHLECEATQVSEPLLTHLEKRLPFSLELAGRWHDVLGDGRPVRSDAGLALGSCHAQTLEL
jgi:hypothetical protein